MSQDIPNIFPSWTNRVVPAVVLLLLGGGVYGALLVPYALAPATLNVGYQPKQPVAYSHAVHAGQLGIDCRYCHTTVESAAQAALPSSELCWNCHGKTTSADGVEVGPAIQWDSDKLRPLKEAHTENRPINWVKVHALPDYVFFDHSAHLNAGVSCVECHGRVDKMAEVRQVEDLTMGFCLECHRAPAEKLRPQRHVTDLAWERSQATDAERREIERLQSTLKTTRQLTDCSTCHR